MGQQCAESNSKNSNINFERGFERDQTYRLALISRNLAELARLNLDLVPIKGPRQTLESKLASGASRANWFVDFNFDIGAALSFVLFLALATYLRYYPPPSFRVSFSRFIPRSYDFRRSDDRARNRRLYGRTPVIGWSRFIDGGISPFERACWTRRAARRFRPRSRFPVNFRRRCDRIFEFPFYAWQTLSTICRLRACAHHHDGVAFLESLMNFPRNKTPHIKYCTFTVLKQTCRAHDTTECSSATEKTKSWLCVLRNVHLENIPHYYICFIARVCNKKQISLTQLYVIMRVEFLKKRED